MIEASNLNAGELAALLHFHADAGVEFLLEDEGVDRFAEFAASVAMRAPAPAAPAQERAQRPSPAAAKPAPRPVSATAVAIPGEEAVEMARRAAEAATSLAELKQAIDAFEGCNLKASARNSVFPTEVGTLPILIFGATPSAEDDREGVAFSGAHGELLAKMFGAIGIDIAETTLAHTVPWRPPGGRPPTPAEAEICRPFAMRLIALTKPRFIVMLGNFATRYFTGSAEAIHALRGQWFEIGSPPTEAIAMLHPQDLMTAPLSKRLAWMDLLALEQRMKQANA
ncbi:uracil-DNA glycosylase [Rhizobium sp. C4]|uniref:uracil-DNA glycosylase n=1 Tax=Rhizobium sp. C4 TaxID=1349800 RepID=UPI001E4F8C40|nr:uracil-DNA glycosylase [Rhizobium sp. C4]MCD2171998.1 uracil-DNA glycosylase [Rhizobium sp. C4]